MRTQLLSLLVCDGVIGRGLETRGRALRNVLIQQYPTDAAVGVVRGRSLEGPSRLWHSQS